MKKSPLVVVLIFAIGLSSCIEPVYIPNKTSIPMFRREKQGYVNAAYVDDSGPTLNAAYAFISPLYVGAGFNVQDKLEPFTGSFKTSFYYGEIGYYYWFHPMVSAELATGYGLGSSETYDELGDSASRRYDHNLVSYDRLHVQTSLCFHFNVNGNEREDPWRDFIVEAALSGRFSFLSTSKYDVTHYDTNNNISSTESKSYSQTFFEPSITLRLGVEHLMLEGQVGWSKIPGNSDNAIPHKEGFFAVGIVSRF